jgi:hypothetical protein
VAACWQHGSQDGKIEPQLFGPEKFLSIVTGCCAPFEVWTRRQVHQLRRRKVNTVGADAPIEVVVTPAGAHKHLGAVTLRECYYFTGKSVQFLLRSGTASFAFPTRRRL